MTRSGFFVALCLAAVVVVGSLCIAANHGGEGEQSIENVLAVQKAVAQARDYLMRDEAKKAVEVLEANLSHVNGDRKYLALLRDAYRSYVKDLTLAHQTAQAELYEHRLKILDTPEPSAPASSSQPASAPSPAPIALDKVKSPGKGPTEQGPVVKADTLRVSPAPLASTGPVVDPFDTANQVKLVAGGFLDKPSPALDLLARAEVEFVKAHYSVAKQLYEQAYQADAKILNEEGRRRWAYCQLWLVNEQVNNYPAKPCDWTKLETDVKIAVAAAPYLQKNGDEILQSMAKRRAATPGTVIRSAMPTVAVKHLAKDKSGWLIAETAHFRVLHNQTQDFAESVAQKAEFTRSQMSRKWLGQEDDNWTPKCDIYLHANAAEYSQLTEQHPSAPGHSKIELDKGAGRIVCRQVHLRCDNPSLLDAILPHETTHVVLAGQFGKFHVPRWADEGIAVLSEPAEKVQQHRKNLVKSLQGHELIPLRDLLQMDAYPPANQIGTFYAQSVALVDFLAKQKDAVVLTRFIRDGLQIGYEQALKTHYGYQSIGELQDRFTERMLAETSGVSATNAER